MCTIEELRAEIAMLREKMGELEKEQYQHTVKLMTNGTDALTERERQAEERGARKLVNALHNSGRCNLTPKEMFDIYKEGRK